MKILLLSMARTRSSVLIDALSKKYQVPNLYEEYGYVSPENISKLVLFKKPTDLWNKLQTETLKKTKEIFLQNSFAIKLFPANIFNDFQYNTTFNKNIDWRITNQSILDLEKYFNVAEYDQVYILNRKNICDMICSYWHAYNRSFFLTDNKKIAHKFQPKGKLSIRNTHNETYIIKCNIIYNKYLNNISKYFDKKNKNYTLLDYDDVPNYLQTNFSDINLSTVDTEYDYKNLIENYNEIYETICKLKEEVERDFPDTIF